MSKKKLNKDLPTVSNKLSLSPKRLRNLSDKSSQGASLDESSPRKLIYQNSMLSDKKRKRNQQILSVDTGIRSMLRREATTKSFALQSKERRIQRRLKNNDSDTFSKGGCSPFHQQSGALPAINEQIKMIESNACYSPTGLIKESLRLHGKLDRRSQMSGSNLGGRGDAYEDFVEQNYRHMQKKAVNRGTYHDLSQSSLSYSKRMNMMNDRAQRHGNQGDFSQLYYSDISALKKLQIVESGSPRAQKFLNALSNEHSGSRDRKSVVRDEDNFGKQDQYQKKAQMKPTASGQRNI